MKSIFKEVWDLAKKRDDQRVLRVLGDMGGLSATDATIDRERLCFCVFQLMNRHKIFIPSSIHAWVLLGGESNLWVRSYVELMERGFSTRDVARGLGISSEEVRSRVKSGELRGKLENGRYFVDPMSV